MGTDSWPLMKMVPYSTSAADAMMFFMILYTTLRMPLMGGGIALAFIWVGWALTEEVDTSCAALALDTDR